MSKNIFLSFFPWVFKKCWKIIFLWFFRLKRHKNVFGRPVSSTWVVLVRCGPLWRTGNVDIFAFKIESKYVSRSVTKVFVGYLYVLNTIFIMLKSQNWFLWRFRASEDWLVKVACMAGRESLVGQLAMTDRKSWLFVPTWSEDMFVGLSPKYFLVILRDLKYYWQSEDPIRSFITLGLQNRKECLQTPWWHS